MRIKKALALAFLLACAGFFLAGPALLRGTRGQARPENPLAGFRPGGGDRTGLRYVGGETCAGCHTEEASAHRTPMGRASQKAADCESLKGGAPLTFRQGAYTYRVSREGAGAVYTVGDGARTVSAPVLFCFGQGVAGQTYIFRHKGLYYESRVSYFTALKSLDITIEHPRSEPASLEQALGRPMSEEAARGCFACHTTGGAAGERLEPERLEAGVSCEACHGPGERHVAAVRSKNFKDLQIYNPSGLDSFELSQEFCGSCHQSFDTVMSRSGQGGAANIRFQPYRIFNSSAHLINDRRLSCVACHDPHKPTSRDAAFYDARCFACHLKSPKEPKTRERAAGACPVAAKDCASCHMPKVELPEMHHSFTDHWIRVARPGAPVPR
jgi:hypothetical protein